MCLVYIGTKAFFTTIFALINSQWQKLILSSLTQQDFGIKKYGEFTLSITIKG